MLLYPFFNFILFYPTIIIVGMGYTRQSVAFGILLLILTFFSIYTFKRKFILIIFSSLIHFPSLLLLSIFLIKSKISFKKYISICILLLSLGLILYQSGEFMTVIAGYTHFIYDSQKHQAPGAFLKVITTLIASLLFFLYYKRFSKMENSSILQKRLNRYLGNGMVKIKVET